MTQLIATSQLTLTNVNDGSQGVPGPKGADGRTPYTHWAYAWSADGTDRFTAVYPKENFLVNTSFKNGLNNWVTNSWVIDSNVMRNGKPTVKGTFTEASPSYKSISQAVSINGLSENDDVVFSVWAKSDNTDGQLHLELWGSVYFADKNVGTEWTRISLKGKLKSVFEVFVWNTQAGTYWISEPKLEKGTEVTPYVPSSSEDYTNAYPSYMGTYTDYTEYDSTNPSDYTWTLIKGEKGDTGADGIAGKDGKGITGTVITYGISASETTQPTNWTASVPTLVKGQYLWTKTVWTYSDNTNETGYTKTYIAKDGNNGSDGIAGKDGVGISSTTITYASSSSGTTAPTSGWTTSVPNVSQGQYLWTKTVWSYTDNTSETGYSVAKIGTDGKSSYTHIAYAYSADGTDRFSSVHPNLNLLYGTKDFSGDWTNSYAWTNDGTYKGLTVKKRTEQWIGIYKTFTAPKDGIYTFSAYIKSTGDNANIDRYVFINGTPVFDGFIKSLGSNFDWTRDSFTISLKASDTILARYEIGGQGSLWTAGHKWEEGSVATLYMPSSSEVITSDWPSHIGQYTNFVQEDSPNPSDYTWSLIRGNDGEQGLPGPKGADGVSISNIKPYFILSNTPTGVVRTSGTWSATPLTPTLSQKYVWTYLETTLSNGTKQYSEPYITGVYGDKGDQGVPGPPGKDGLPTYIHWAYSDNADGTGLTTSDNGQRYIGQYSDNTKTDSMDKTKYRWFDRWGKIKVGGRNLIRALNSNNYSGIRAVKEEGVVIRGGSGATNTLQALYKAKTSGGDHIFSYAMKEGSSHRVLINVYDENEKGIENKSIPGWTWNVYYKGYFKQVSNNGYAVFNAPSETRYITGVIVPPWETNPIVDYTLLWMKLEKGNVATDWSPAPEDIQADIDSKADQKLTQEQINALNEKKQILEAEMQAKASMEAFSEFEKTYQAFVKSNAEGQAKAEADLIEAGRRIEMLTTQFGGLAELKTFIDTYMSSSNEGLIIGKNDASSTIKVSSDRISMFSAGKEVMYISQGVININNGIFTASVQIGKFRTEQYNLNADMNVIRYVG